MVNWSEKLLELLYPPHCMFCGKLLPWIHTQLTCGTCRDALPWIGEKSCEKCGKQLSEAYDKKLCPDCSKTEHPFHKGVSCFVYDEKLKRAVYHLKFEKRRHYGKHLGGYMAKVALEKLNMVKYDILIPVPLSREKKKTRKFNQAEELALGLAAMGTIDTTLLQRSKETMTQSRLSAAARKNNLYGAFTIHPSKEVQGKHILLVDDIYTTGSTADACVFALKEKGASTVDILTLATGMNT